MPEVRLSPSNAPPPEEVGDVSAEQLIKYLREAIEVAKEYRDRYLTARKRLSKVRNYLVKAMKELKTVQSSAQRVDDGCATHLESALDLLRQALEEVVEA